MDTAYVGKAEVSIGGTGQTWDVQSWGGQLAQAVGAGSATEDVTQPIIINFLGNLASTLGDTVILKNFTVIRYPGQANP